MTCSKLTAPTLSATPSARSPARTSGKVERPSTGTAAAVGFDFTHSGWKAIGPAYSFCREVFFWTLGMKLKLHCVIDTGAEGTLANISVESVPGDPALIIRRSRPMRFSTLIKLMNRITTNAHRIGYQGDWKFPFTDWPAAKYQKQVKDAKEVRREFERLSSLKPRYLLA